MPQCGRRGRRAAAAGTSIIVGRGGGGGGGGAGNGVTARGPGPDQNFEVNAAPTVDFRKRVVSHLGSRVNHGAVTTCHYRGTLHGAVVAAACRAYRDPGARNHSQVLSEKG